MRRTIRCRLRRRQLDLDRLRLRPHARLDEIDGAAVDHDPLRERGPDRGRVGPCTPSSSAGTS